MDLRGTMLDRSQGRANAAGSVTSPAERPAERSYDVAGQLRAAINHHQAGRLLDAEALYLEILRNEPGNADALHLLGVIANQVRKYGLAVELIERAIAARPGVAVFHNNLGHTLCAQRKFHEAKLQFERAVVLDPNYADAHNNLGSVHQDLGDPALALASCEQAVRLDPRHADARLNAGVALCDLGRWDEAVKYIEAALRMRPELADSNARFKSRALLLALGHFAPLHLGWRAHRNEEQGLKVLQAVVADYDQNVLHAQSNPWSSPLPVGDPVAVPIAIPHRHLAFRQELHREWAHRWQAAAVSRWIDTSIVFAGHVLAYLGYFREAVGYHLRMRRVARLRGHAYLGLAALAHLQIGWSRQRAPLLERGLYGDAAASFYRIRRQDRIVSYTGSLEDVLRLYSRAREEASELAPDSLERAGRALLENGQPAQALEALRSAGRLRPQSLVTREHIVAAAFQSGHEAAALRLQRSCTAAVHTSARRQNAMHDCGPDTVAVGVDSLSETARRHGLAHATTLPASKVTTSYRVLYRGEERHAGKEVEFAAATLTDLAGAESLCGTVLLLDRKTLLWDTQHLPKSFLDMFCPYLRAFSGSRALLSLPDTSYRLETSHPVMPVMGFGQNYYHYLFEILPSLALGLEQASSRNAYVVFEKGVTEWQRALLHKLGIPDERLVWVTPGHVWSASHVLFPSFVSRDLVVSPASARFVRERVGGIHGAGTRKRGKRLYLARSKEYSARRRTMRNEQGVVDMLGRYGFEAVYPDRLSVSEQVELFADAEIVAGPVGAAFSNLAFCPAGTQVIMLTSAGGWAETYTTLTATLQQPSTVCLGSHHVRPNYQTLWTEFDFEVHLPDFERALRDAIDAY
jgi:capsular polysaccharide biosynthesis protein/tetratricopeptide (TPR) repeat protein